MAKKKEPDHETEHVPGKMDISEQERTFEGFIRLTVWGAAISIGVLIFLALVNS